MRTPEGVQEKAHINTTRLFFVKSVNKTQSLITRTLLGKNFLNALKLKPPN